MGSEYDENLEENPFFQQLRIGYSEILKTASENSWIICIPRLGSFLEPTLSKNDILEHILIPVINNQHYQNLNHIEIEKIHHVLVFRCNDLTRRVRILFSEEFFMGNLKYSVWCIEEPLNQNQAIKGTELLEINSFCDCINFLWTDTLGCKLLEEINSIVLVFLNQCNIEELDTLQLRNLLQNTYDHCLYKALECFQTRLEDENFLSNLKLAVETFMYACVKGKLFNCLCTIASNSDASLNKIIRNSQEIPLHAFKINHDFYDVLPIAKLELNKINNTYTILNKITCLKRTFKVLSKDRLSSETLLGIFIFLILKSNIYNWTANVIFMAKFRFCDFETSQENNFLITTLQAALKYISDGGLKKLEFKAAEFESCQSDFHKLVSFIEEGNLDSLINAVTYTDKLSRELCHPLCSCDNCELLLKTNTCQIDSRDDKGRSLLHIAAKANRTDVVQSLIAKGAHVDVTDYSGLTPLHYAVSAGNQQVAFLLLHAGCAKNICDSEGNTPLHIATRNGQDCCVKTLIYSTENHGSDLEVNCRNNSGDTPLHFAAKYGYVNLVNLLIEYGAKIVFNNRSLSPHNFAHNDRIRNILKSVSILSKDIATKRSLFKSLKSSEEIRLVTDKKCKDSQTQKGNSKPNCCKKDSENFGIYPKNLDQFKKTDLLLKAIENNDLPLSCFYLGIPMPHASSVAKSNCHPLCTCEKCQEVVEDDITPVDLKQQTLNINICNPDGYSPLHLAAKYGRTETLRLLLDAGALVNLKTYKPLQTPLHLSCIFRNKQIVKEILKCGNCSIDPLDYHGNTPLHHACLNNDLEIFELLINHGANANIKNHEGKSVIDEAKERVFCDITRILNERMDYKKCNIEDIL